jgi:lipid-A-disaccharide synthase
VRTLPELASYTAPVSASRRLLVVAGEASGDLYAAELVRELRRLEPELTVYGMGGDRLADAGTTLLAHIRDSAVVGLLEVVSHLSHLRAVYKKILAQVDAERPDAAVLVDYPDFNLRLAKELKKRGIPVIYYVSPQLWAWRGGRMRHIAQSVAHMMVIFPFEEALYRAASVPVTFVGHPLVDIIRAPTNAAAFRTANGIALDRRIVTLLPGSRPKEVAYNLPPLLRAADQLAERIDLQFVVAQAPHLDTLVAELVGSRPIRVVAGQTHAALAVSSLALVASGTATVETALLDVPMVVVYRLSPLTYALGRPLVRVPHYAMVNLIAEAPVVPELIQSEFTAERVVTEARRLLDNPVAMERMRSALAEVRGKLGAPGASARAAAVVASYLPH